MFDRLTGGGVKLPNQVVTRSEIKMALQLQPIWQMRLANTHLDILLTQR